MKKRTDIADIAKGVRQQLKKEYPACKFSVTIERFSMGRAMNVCLMSAPFEALQEGDWHNGYAQLNQYTLRGSADYHNYNCNGALLTKKAWEIMRRADEIADAENWNKSDAMIDYFDVNYYLHLSIGKWDRPFEAKK